MTRHLTILPLVFVFATLPASAILDTNGNGLSDLWETQFKVGDHLSANLDPAVDDDGDGWTNAQEAAAGTDPFDPNAPDGYLRPETTRIPEHWEDTNGDGIDEFVADSMTMVFVGLPGKQYTLLTSTDLAEQSWFQVEDPFISNGDETTYCVYVTDLESRFWRISVTDADTDGDGFTDHEEYGLGSNAASAISDSDHDGLTDAEEHELGTDPNKTDSDEDGSDDGEDAAPTDKAIWWPGTPTPRYAIVATGIQVGEFDDISMPIDINRSGEILVKFDPGASRGDWGIWSPATGQTRDVTPPMCYGGDEPPWFGDLISDSRIAEDGSHHASLIDTYFTDQMSIFLPPDAASQPPEDDDWILHFPGSRDSAPPLISYHVDTVDSWSLSTKWDTTAQEFAWKSRHLAGGNWSDAQSDVGSFADAPLSISSAGGVLFKDRIKRPGQPDLTATGTPFDSTCRLGTVLVAAPEPGQPDQTRAVHVVIGNSGMWVEKPDAPTLLAATSSALPDLGRITENGTGLDSLGVWLNGSIYSLEDLVSPSGWSNIRPVAMSTNGLIAATAERDATGLREIVLLEPLAIRAFPTAPWDGNTPYDPKGFAKGNDRMSSFASGGDGKTDEFWITAPIGGDSTWVRFLTAAHPSHSIGMTANPHFSGTLQSPDEYETIIGSGTSSVDIPVTFKISGTTEADNHPVRLKVMKRRTVNVALHEVIGLDKNGVPTEPLFMPDPALLASYLNQVYGPQVNVNFEVEPFVEAGSSETGIDFDLGNSDGELRLDDTQEVDAATPNAKARVTGSGFNIDVWVVGGVSLKAPPKVGIEYDHLFGITLPNSSTMGRRIIIDGDMVGFSEVPAGLQTHHLHFCIAHEIGHLMTDDVHPGDSGYKSELIWGGGPDPYLRRRLMGSGTQLDHAHPEVCLIKKEWDWIEAWLKHEEDEGRL